MFLFHQVEDVSPHSQDFFIKRRRTLLKAAIFYFHLILQNSHDFFNNVTNPSLSHFYMRAGSEAFVRDVCRCNFAFSIIVRLCLDGAAHVQSLRLSDRMAPQRTQ